MIPTVDDLDAQHAAFTWQDRFGAEWRWMTWAGDTCGWGRRTAEGRPWNPMPDPMLARNTAAFGPFKQGEPLRRAQRRETKHNLRSDLEQLLVDANTLSNRIRQLIEQIEA